METHITGLRIVTIQQLVISKQLIPNEGQHWGEHLIAKPALEK